jgi:hypothetical protein
MHTALVSRLIKDRSAWELARVPVEGPGAAIPADVEDEGARFSRPALQGA